MPAVFNLLVFRRIVFEPPDEAPRAPTDFPESSTNVPGRQMNQHARSKDEVKKAVLEWHVKGGPLQNIDVPHVLLAPLDGVALQLHPAEPCEPPVLQAEKLVADVGTDLQDPEIARQLPDELG